jgi:glutathione S-transferase
MKLYYATATCSHAVHIALREADLPFSLVRFDMKSGALADGGRLEDVNPKGFVPVLELADGRRLTEVSAILQYVADQAPERRLAPPWGSFERYRLLEWLSFIATEIHKAYWPLFHDGAEVENEKARARLTRNFAWVETQLGAGPWLLGDDFTVADAYLVTVLNWTRAAKIDLAPWPGLAAYRLRARARPAVTAALDAEGLLKK